MKLFCTRRFTVLIAGVFILTTSFFACRAKVNTLGVQVQIEKKTLSNGLTVLMVEDHSMPLISYQTWYRVGSVDERLGITGISHLFEHLMFKGTAKYGPRELFRILESKGAEVNAYTTRDYTVYYENFSSKSDLLEKVIDLESDRMVNLELTENGLNHEKMVVFEERRLRTENVPEGKMQEAIWQLAYKRHPYQWPISGYPADLQRMSLDDVKAYYKNYYQPATATVVIVGDFKVDDTFDLIKKYYKEIPKQTKPKRKPLFEPAQGEERRLIIRDQIASERFVQAYHISSAEQDDSYSLDVLSNILFDGATSRAYRKLVEEKDISIGITGSAFTPAYPGLFIISGTMKGKVPSVEAESALQDVIGEVQEKGVTEEEVKRAVKQLTLQVLDGIQSYHGLGQLIGTVQTIFEDPGRFSSDLDKYSHVTPAMVKTVAQKYLNPNNRSVVTLEVKK